MESIFTKTFWIHSFERAFKTSAQSIVLAWGGGDAIANLFVFDWKVALGAGGGGAILSVLTSIISAPMSRDDTPDLVNDTPADPPPPK